MERVVLPTHPIDSSPASKPVMGFVSNGRARKSRWLRISMSLTPRWNACWNCSAVYTAAISGAALPETPGSGGGGGFGGGFGASRICDGVASARACTRSGADYQCMTTCHAPPLEIKSTALSCGCESAPIHDASYRPC